ncbi:SPOR domain-containing protein [Paludibacterium yongneupense]|nr:SPOR domain-containing protein [Paludibacterium yongneupense]
MLAGLVIGLIVGVAVVVGVVMYLSKSSTPFTNMEKTARKPSASASESPTEMLAPGTSIASAPRAEAVPPAAPAPAAPAADAATPPSAAVSAPAPQAASQPGRQPAPHAGKPVDGKNGQRFDFYKILPGQVDPVPSTDSSNQAEPSAASVSKKAWLQLGAFQNQDDADNLKAKLALLGIEAKIQSLTIQGKGMVHRVRVGPLLRQEDVDRLRLQLRQNGINAVVVKIDN